MGLEDFQTGDSSSSSSSSSNSPSTKQLEPSNTKSQYSSVAKQRFGPGDLYSPRRIRYWIKSVHANWFKQFSTYRFDDGETTFVSQGTALTEGDDVLKVFTTIRSYDDPEYDGEYYPIWVVPWDRAKSEPVGEGVYIENDEDWGSELMDTILDYIQEFNSRE